MVGQERDYRLKFAGVTPPQPEKTLTLKDIKQGQVVLYAGTYYLRTDRKPGYSSEPGQAFVVLGGDMGPVGRTNDISSDPNFKEMKLVQCFFQEIG